ncbi:MAG: MlaC/ttg2D family ABC transporter substrate-binding protein, partial [Gammaproteobacteria bacterium]
MKVRSLLLLSILLGPMPAGAADFSTPTARVKDSVEKVIAVLRDASLDSEQRWQRIAPIIDDGFDFRSMSQSVLANNWKKATPEERERFVEFFSQYIEAVYREKIEAYTDQEVIYKSEAIEADRAVVETLILRGSTEIPVNFKLKNNSGQWYAYDVVIEGVSLVANYRSTFAAIVNNEGMEGLLTEIEQRIQAYVKEHPE